MDEKEHSIRFINSSYDTLFRIPDGGTVEVQFPDRKFSAKCEYIDDYHTLVGDSVFHICEFAEMVEHQHGSVRPEPETELDQAAWQLGHREYLALQTTDSGYSICTNLLLLTKEKKKAYYNNCYITTITNKGGPRMPPKARITAEMIVDATVEVVRQSGFESINARTVSQQLHCSTQPVMYHFSTIDSLKRAAYRRTDHLHSEYLMNTPPGQDPILGIGLNYVRFAVEEPQLFRFLFQSGYAEEKSLLEMVDSEELLPVLEAMREGAGLSLRKTRNVFITVALFAHGYASIIANNHLEYDEKLIAEHLERTWNGAVLEAAQEE